MLVIAEMVSFVKRFLLPPVCAERCWMYRLYSSLWQENVQLTICSIPSWSPLCFFLSVFSSNTQRCWLSDGDWLPEEVGWLLPPFITYCHLIGHLDLPWPYGWKDLSHFWIWPGQQNLSYSAYIFQVLKNHLSGFPVGCLCEINNIKKVHRLSMGVIL